MFKADEDLHQKPTLTIKRTSLDAEDDSSSDEINIENLEKRTFDDYLREELKKKGYFSEIIDNADSNQLRVYYFESNTQ